MTYTAIKTSYFLIATNSDSFLSTDFGPDTMLMSANPFTFP